MTTALARDESFGLGPLGKSFCEGVLKASPNHASFLHSVLKTIPDTIPDEMESYLRFCLDEGLTQDYLVDCYNTIVEDTKREQIYFLRHKKYRYSKFDEVAGNVYFNDSYMKKYMYGLALTSFLWPNHNAMNAFFSAQLPHDKKGTYLEIGPGHGRHFIEARQAGRFERMIALDISETSLALTKRIYERHVPDDDRARFVLADFFTYKPEEAPFSAIVMGEVLEHVEQPQKFLEKIASLADKNSFVYITTCVNAPAVDHIYLFKTAKEVEDMIAASGFTIVEKYYAPYFGKTYEESVEEMLPVNVAYSLRKK